MLCAVIFVKCGGKYQKSFCVIFVKAVSNEMSFQLWSEWAKDIVKAFEKSNKFWSVGRKSFEQCGISNIRKMELYELLDYCGILTNFKQRKFTKIVELLS